MSDTVPCFYILSLVGGYFLQSREADKLGTTWHPSSRKAQFATSHAQAPYFKHVFKLDPTQFSKSSDLYKVDSTEWPEFLKMKGLSSLHVTLGGGMEFFWSNGLVDLVREFLTFKNYKIIEEITNDPYPLRNYTKEDKVKFDREENEKEEYDLFKNFMKVFLPTFACRRIQTELWYLFQKICETPEDILYKGIIQWPTGVGKTIGMLMLIVLVSERYKQRGKIYRGLLISPKNDIFNTISPYFNKLSQFGINIYDGSNGKLSSLVIPKDKNILVMACHQALTSNDGMKRLPAIVHVHYDEVHRITGEEFFTLLQEMLEVWKTEILTGTSATPKTCSPSQHTKLKQLFGEPYNILHKCDVDEAVKEGWIAPPRFIVHIGKEIDNTDAHLRGYVKATKSVIELKGCGGKIICYIETSIDDVRDAARIARDIIPNAKIYTAIDGERTDADFIAAPVDGSLHILFACQRYREGSDIKGLEMTAKLAGTKMSAHIIIQIQGRALRLDYPGKEGWCLIYRPSPEGTTSQDVLDSIILDIMEFIGDKKKYEKKDIERFVELYMGSITLDGTTCSTSETVERVQAAYLRKEYTKRTPKEKYSLVKTSIHSA